MPEESEPKARTVSIQLFPVEEDGIQFVRDLHPKGKYDSVTAVLRDYSVGDCVRMLERARAVAASA